MAGSNFSIINGADGVTKIPVSTPANDTNGNTVVAHLAMTEVAGVATPISATNPAPVVITNLPASPIFAATPTAASALVAKASPGSLLGATATSTASGYLVAIDAAAVPAPGGTLTPKHVDAVGAGGTGGFALPVGVSEPFANGITVLFSSTVFTYTPSATAFISVIAQ